VPLLGRGKEFSKIFAITPGDSPKLNYIAVARKRIKTTVESGIILSPLQSVSQAWRHQLVVAYGTQEMV